MANTVISQTIANGQIYANGYYGTGLANGYAFRSQSFIGEAGSAEERYVDVFNVNMATYANAAATVYFYNYASADRIEIYQGNTLIADTSNATILTAYDRAFVLSQRTGEFFNDSPDLYLKDFNLVTIGDKFYATYAGKITWTHNPSAGASYTIRTYKGNGSHDWRYILEFPIDGNTVGCPPEPPANPPPPPPPVVVTPAGGGGGCGCKIVCTAMNDAYGFGFFRQKIWLASTKDQDPAIQVGYHFLFLPLVRYIYYSGEQTLHKQWLRYLMEKVVKHRTMDLWLQKRGKRDPLGRTFRAFFEPVCWFFGKIIGSK